MVRKSVHGITPVHQSIASAFALVGASFVLGKAETFTYPYTVKTFANDVLARL